MLPSFAQASSHVGVAGALAAASGSSYTLNSMNLIPSRHLLAAAMLLLPYVSAG